MAGQVRITPISQMAIYKYDTTTQKKTSAEQIIIPQNNFIIRQNLTSAIYIEDINQFLKIFNGYEDGISISTAPTIIKCDIIGGKYDMQELYSKTSSTLSFIPDQAVTSLKPTDNNEPGTRYNLTFEIVHNNNNDEQTTSKFEFKNFTIYPLSPDMTSASKIKNAIGNGLIRRVMYDPTGEKISTTQITTMYIDTITTTELI